ncbi:uncharacterized protein LOC131436459 [Malaya genurostris]|uniref:uncharacterized protein LOC131436459 n=1 Tax=Malaya genurostris TaxID=325434 RepID=UPI0026F3C6EA|nr:uncharacterized protein LOC131436459 [Malaya genurostris]
MGSCTKWIEMSQKNKPQSNTLTAGIMTLLTTGMLVGSTIFNMDIQRQTWALNHSDTTILFTLICFYMAAIVGSIAACFFVERFEKKPLSKVYLVLVIVASILLIVLPNNIVAMAFARVLFGLAHGMAYVIILIHGGEVSIKELRGLNISAVNYCLILGAVTHGVFTPIHSYNELNPNRLVGILGLTYAVIGAGIAQFLTYESPVYLIQRGREGEAIQAMMKLRNDSTETWEIRNDYTEFKTMLQEDDETSQSIFQDGNIRPLVLLSLCKLASVLSFNMALNLVRLNILDELFGYDDYSISAVMIMMVRLIMGSLFLFVIDRFGRKAPILLSTIASGSILAITGLIYLVADYINRDVGIALILTYEVVSSTGLTIVPDVYSSEAFNTKKKAASIAALHTVENILQILITVVVFSWDFTDGYKQGAVMITCGFPLLALSGIFYRWLPETNKMTIRQTRTEFSKHGEIVFSGTKTQPHNFLND